MVLSPVQESKTLTPPPLFRLIRLTAHADTSEIERVCIALDASGSYRLEQRKESDITKSSRVYEGQVTAEEMAAFHAIIDSPSFKALTFEMPKQRALTMRAIEEIAIGIQDADRRQLLTVMNYYGVHEGSNNRNITDDHARELRPVIDWVSKSIEKRKVNLVKDSQPVCPPLRQ